jgi:hypothetical protein
MWNRMDAKLEVSPDIYIPNGPAILNKESAYVDTNMASLQGSTHGVPMDKCKPNLSDKSSKSGSCASTPEAQNHTAANE